MTSKNILFSITEVGVMNIFIHIKNSKGESELITPPLDGTILPGVTRKSILDYCKDEKINAIERKMEMSEFIDLHSKGRLVELFGCGTATLITPISVLNYKNKDYAIDYKGKSGGPLSEKFYKDLSNIQNGLIKHKFQREII